MCQYARQLHFYMCIIKLINSILLCGSATRAALCQEYLTHCGDALIRARTVYLYAHNWFKRYISVLNFRGGRNEAVVSGISEILPRRGGVGDGSVGDISHVRRRLPSSSSIIFHHLPSSSVVFCRLSMTNADGAVSRPRSPYHANWSMLSLLYIYSTVRIDSM
jgi:hypothetical protein